MASWPGTLPNPTAAGYQLQPGDQTLRTEMEVGSPRVRRRTVVRNDRVAVAWVLTDTQLDALRDWFDDASTGIAGGSAWFTVSLAVGGNTLLESKEARFVGPFQAAREQTRWRVTATLEVR
jgi:hypothetical protein